MARRRADHLGRHDRRDRAVLQSVLPRPIRQAGSRDGALNRVPSCGAHLAGDDTGTASGVAPRGRLDARFRNIRYRNFAFRTSPAMAAREDQRRAVGVLRGRRGSSRPSRCGYLTSQGSAAAWRPRDRRRRCHRGADGRAPGHRRADRARRDRDRDRGERRRDVGSAVRGARRGARAVAGGRALLLAHRHGPGNGPRPALDRGPGRLRLLPARRRRHAGRPLRTGRRAVVDRRRPARLRVRQAAA